MSVEKPAGPANPPAALAALVYALALGVAGDLLLRTAQPGINLWIMSLLLQVVVVVLHRRYAVPLPRASLGLLGIAGLFLLSFAWRDSEALNLLALLSALTAAGLAAWLASGARLLRSTLVQHCVGLARAGLGAGVGFVPLVLRDVSWTRLHQSSRHSGLIRVGRGLALAVPPVIVFGALFTAADPIFGSFSTQLFDFDLEEFIVHLVFAGFIAWGVGGFLREIVAPGSLVGEAPFRLRGGIWSFTETAVVLGAVNLIFLLFVAVQLRSLFGGASFIFSQTGLTTAEYARQGFFHLAGAAAFVLPLLLFTEWISGRSPAEERSFRALTILLLFLLGLVLLSAAYRMRLYQLSYGLTEPRVYTMAFMLWLAGVLGWFWATVVRGRRERFTSGAIGLGFLVVLGLHLLNPDRLIARVNLDRVTSGHEFDSQHASTLSDDALPILIEAMPGMSSSGRCRVVSRLSDREGDWRSWNLARARAAELADRYAPALAEWQRTCSARSSLKGE
jgi:Domain of unknown function (DUF4173)